MKAKTVIDVALGEAGGKTAEHRYNDLKHIFSVMANRARLTGTTIADVALKRSQFNAYGKRMPAGVEKYRSLAERALKEVQEEGPVTDALYYATPAATKNLPKGLEFQTNTTAHRYFTDPQMRGIVTRQGAKALNREPTIRNVPTPTFADRAGTGLNQADSATGIMSAVNPATPVGVTRGLLADATVERGVTPGASAVGALSYRAPEDMASLQARANLARQQMEARNGRLNLSEAQTADAMRRREAGLGILAASNPVAAIEKVSPLQTASVTPKTSLASAYGQMADTMGQAGVLDLSGQKVRDPNDILGVGKLAPMPGALAVETMPAVNTTVATMPIVEGPATVETVMTQPQVTARRASQPVGLLSGAELDAVRAQHARLQAQGANKRAQLGAALKSGLGAFGGGVLGGMLAGPLGAVVGGYLGNNIATPGGILSSFPEAPKGGILGDGKETDYGRSVRESSGQYRSAVSKGSKGLY